MHKVTSRGAALAGSLAGAVFLVGCGSGGGSVAPAADAKASASALAAGGQDGVTKARERYESAREPLSFKAVGAPLNVATAAAGKSVVILSISDAIPILNLWGTTIAEALKKYGVKVTRADAQSNPEKAARAIGQAISSRASAVILNAVPPDLIAPQIADAQKAGIPVISTNDTAEPDVKPHVPGVVVDVSNDYRIPARLMADWFIADSGGKGVALSYLSKGQASSPVMQKAIHDEVAGLCPDCTVSFEDAQIPTWFDGGLQNSARNKLASNKAPTYVLPIYDAMTLAVDPAVAASGKKVAVGSFNATPAVMQNLASSSSAVKLDVGCPNDWFSLSTADATFRLLAGQPVPDNYGITCRVFDKSNIGKIDPSKEVSTNWYGIDFQAEFAKLWGPPSG
jgi:ribose transport system substrate-binding protein